MVITCQYNITKVIVIALILKLAPLKERKIRRALTPRCHASIIEDFSDDYFFTIIIQYLCGIFFMVC